MRQRSFVYVAFIYDTRPPNVRPGTKNAGRRSRKTDAKTVCTRYIWVHMYLYFQGLFDSTNMSYATTDKYCKKKISQAPTPPQRSVFYNLRSGVFFVFSPQPQAFRTRKPPDRKLRFLNRLFFTILLSQFFYFHDTNFYNSDNILTNVSLSVYIRIRCKRIC